MLVIALLAQYWQYVLALPLGLLEAISKTLDEILKHPVLLCLLLIIYRLGRIRKAVESLKEAK